MKKTTTQDKSLSEFSNFFLNRETEKKEEFISTMKKIISSNLNENERKQKIYQGYIYWPNKKIDNDLNEGNILLFSHELSRTGAPMVVLDTAKVLIDKGYFVTIISLKDGPLQSDFSNYGIPVIISDNMKYVQYKRSDISLFLDYIILDTLIEQFDFNIFMTATLFNFVKRYFHKSNRILWWLHEGSESYNILGNLMPRNLSSNIEVFCGGKYVSLQLKNYGFNYQNEVLNYGIYDEYVQKSKKQKDKITFLLAGTIGSRKGQLILLDAIKKLPNSLKDQCRFLFVGDAYDNDIVGAEILLKLKEYEEKDQSIKIFPSMDREKLYSLYEEIDILVIPSIDDPMPVVATENFMLKNICLCSNLTGTSYYINDNENGFVFDLEDENALTEKIKYIIENKNNLNEIKNNGRKLYENEFDIKIFSNNLINIIKRG